MIAAVACWLRVQDLAPWRAPDSRGNACASCHSPDGIELAVYGFDSENLLRRAAKHFDVNGQSAILAYLLDLRTRTHAVRRDPMRDRPMQPGGSTLPGTSAEARDAAFALSLRSVLPLTLGKRVSSYASARAVGAELLSVDLRKLPVGIEMNRLSEDGFHGKEHASLAHWIPDNPIPLSESLRKAEDAYLRHPSRSTLAVVDRAAVASFSPRTQLDALSLAKFRTLLIEQHQLRIEVGLATSEPLDSHTPARSGSEYPTRNPFWEIGDIARFNSSADPQSLGLPIDVAAAKTPGTSVALQMQSMRLPWYWLGWVADPSLTHSGAHRETKRGDWFVESLMLQNYTAHAVFMLGRKLHEQSIDATRTEPWEMQFSFLLYGKPLIELEPKEPQAKAAFRALAGNVFRSVIYTVREDVKRSHRCLNPESQSLQLRLIRAYLRASKQPEEALIQETTHLLSVAKPYGRAR